MKKQCSIWHFLLAAILFISASQISFAEVKLPNLLTDGAVLQRDKPMVIWGWANSNEKIEVNFEGVTKVTHAKPNGDWVVTFSSMKAGGPYVLEVEGEKESLTVNNLWIGDVWICSGQSNMELTMERVAPMFPDEFERSPNPQIRYFDVPDHYDFQKEAKDTKGGNWIEAGPEHLKEFSAVAYFFAKHLHEKYKIPIGLVNSSVGGSPIQSWIRKQELKSFPEDYQEAEKFSDPNVIEEIQENDRAKRDAWQRELLEKDRGLTNSNKPYFDPSISTEGWEKMNKVDLLPRSQDKLPNGVYWLRKEIDISSVKSEDSSKLLLGRLIDSDRVYFNGELVGSTSYQYPPRRYEVPKELIKEGKNTLVIRLVSERGRPGFVTDKPYQIKVGDKTYNLSTDWKYIQTAEMSSMPGQTFIRWKPLGLYQGMIAPLQRIPAKGIIWYQGESNAGNPGIYCDQMKALIEGWRSAWEQPDMPFIFAQLPNFMQPVDQPVQEGWAGLREAQRQALEVPNTGMAVTIDAGEANDIHPLDKETVGIRLAMEAMKVAYGEKGDLSSPMIKKAVTHKSKIKLAFEQVGKGLKAEDGEELGGFAVADKEGDFHRAKAKIKGNKVILESPVTSPTTVRYAWANNPVWANLYGKNGLPASPFEIKVSQ
ncbi:sialate O-acetylesterase [Echinicola jeungdonensis]|uniref:Sialate O-acetylesterase n=1 Tax=Echinicola jeungdonensis TaxID=709343 RepID=A0ABV5JC57_9BACT|nr:sialate O-acetylesterase [Echinicola jeungdonensis]MDN3670417.1 sialate O-acetylesterase [Echinicola jeungdonensis]